MSKLIRKKRSDTLAKTIEKKYKIDLGVRSDTKLSTILKRTGARGVSGVYGGMQQIAGSALPQVKNLELDSGE